MKMKYCVCVGMQLNAFHASKLSVSLNYMNSIWNMKKYLKGKNKSEYISGFYLKFSTVLVYLNMSNVTP
jgi:hypothetical protein